MATACPVIGADGHILELQDGIRSYLDGPYKNRKTQLWPANFQPWDSGLTGKIDLGLKDSRGFRGLRPGKFLWPWGCGRD